MIDELVAEREHTSARLAKIDAAIATMRDLFHLPPGEKPAAALRISKGSKARTAPTPGATRKGDQALDAIREALKAGPLSPGELETKLKISRYMLNYPREAARGRRRAGLDRDHDLAPDRAGRHAGEGGAPTMTIRIVCYVASKPRRRPNPASKGACSAGAT